MISFNKIDIRDINNQLKYIRLDYDEYVDIDVIISNIIQNYNPTSIMQSIPSMIKLHAQDFNDKIIEKLSLLNKKSVAIEINNNLLGNKDILNKIRQIKKELEIPVVVQLNKGDRMFGNTNSIANIVSIDMKSIPNVFNVMYLGQDANQLDSDINILAFNISTPEDYKIAESIGASYFSGEYIGTAEKNHIDIVGYSRVNLAQIMLCLSETKPCIDKLVGLIQRDCLLTAMIIRLSNSPYFNNGNVNNVNIGSIRDAIEIITLEKLNSWLYMLTFHTVVDESLDDRIRMSLMMATFCRELSKNIIDKNINPKRAYLMGLLSLLDTITGNPLEQEISGLNLNHVIEDALLYREGTGGMLLNLSRAYTNADEMHTAEYAKKLKIAISTVESAYSKSIIEVSNVWNSLTMFGELNKY